MEYKIRVICLVSRSEFYSASVASLKTSLKNKIYYLEKLIFVESWSIYSPNMENEEENNSSSYLNKWYELSAFWKMFKMTILAVLNNFLEWLFFYQLIVVPFSLCLKFMASLLVLILLVLVFYYKIRVCVYTHTKTCR